MDRKRSVLLLEDNHALAETYRQALADEFELDVTTTAAETRDMIRSRIYDAIVCDLFILGDVRARSSRGGLTLIGELRSGQAGYAEWCQTVPIIAITGAVEVDGLDAQQAAIDAGANVMLAKPIEPGVLLSTLAAEIERTPKPSRFSARRRPRHPE